MLTRILTGLVGVPIIVWLLHSGGMLCNICTGSYRLAGIL